MKGLLLAFTTPMLVLCAVAIFVVLFATIWRTLNYWRNRGELKATKFTRHVWHLIQELERFLRNKTET